ncbi:unnamed protein product [Rhizoctonia solani]|uniref:Uncharacterized protein n=1 Tax=Rhizoctonia solani TaxID=456999 RepID=A0A8H3H2Q3_9AGAM|nr:unnamed protein product [Rhizoctonia solani]
MPFNTQFLATSSINPSSFQPPSISCNYLFNSSKGVRDYRQRIRIEFPGGWNHEGDPITQWYNRQPNSKFRSVEYRKERGGVQHEYILVLLQNNDGARVDSYCRLERVADPTHRMEAIGVNGTTAFDFVQTIDPNDSEFSAQVKADAESELVSRIVFPRMFDLADILAICYGIYTHPRAKRYTLQQFNCYFFSWTIILCLARRAADWESALHNSINEIRGAVTKHVKNLRSSQTFTAWSLVFRVHDASDTHTQQNLIDSFLHEISSECFLNTAGELLCPLLWYDQDPHRFRPALATCLESVVNQAANPLLDDLNLQGEAVDSQSIPELARICWLMWMHYDSKFGSQTTREVLQAKKRYVIECAKQMSPASQAKILKIWAKEHLCLLGPGGSLMLASTLCALSLDNFDRHRAALGRGNIWECLHAPLLVAKTIFDLPRSIYSSVDTSISAIRWDCYSRLTRYIPENDLQAEGVSPLPVLSFPERYVNALNQGIRVFTDRYPERDADTLRQEVVNTIRCFYKSGHVAHLISDDNTSMLWKVSLQVDLGNVISQSILDTVIGPSNASGCRYECYMERNKNGDSEYAAGPQSFSHPEIQDTIRERISRLSKREVEQAPIAQYVLRLPFTTPPLQAKEEMETAIQEIWGSCGPLMS